MTVERARTSLESCILPRQGEQYQIYGRRPSCRSWAHGRFEHSQTTTRRARPKAPAREGVLGVIRGFENLRHELGNHRSCEGIDAVPEWTSVIDERTRSWPRIYSAMAGDLKLHEEKLDEEKAKLAKMISHEDDHAMVMRCCSQGNVCPATENSEGP